MGPAGMGSIQIGSKDGVYSVLTANTVMALEATFSRCAQDGRVFTFRLYQDSDDQIISMIITPSTPVKFGYKLADADSETLAARAREYLTKIGEDGALTVGIPNE